MTRKAKAKVIEEEEPEVLYNQGDYLAIYEAEDPELFTVVQVKSINAAARRHRERRR
jgi:hypothetical protein